ncbi:STM3941 family protein [Winogradskyella sediminis]|uniref:STM3941 family protein n=1 Tax=Winogradskyella sediminis TaxID=1382466 RepID=UPI000E272854|nr:STM3941 family protein [Winogradskyella sediminis]REG84614.1 hypothetical protein C8N41_10547 [Winogradskyella sediminis]
MNEIRITLSKTKLVLMLIGCIAFIFGGVYMIIEPYKPDNNRYSEDFLLFIGLASVIFFGLGLFFILKKIFSTKIGLIINELGIIDNSNAISLGLIEWNDISGISIIQPQVPVFNLGTTVSTKKMIILKTDNPEKFIERLRNPILKETLIYNNKIYGSSLTIISSGLNIKFSELENTVKEQMPKWKK